MQCTCEPRPSKAAPYHLFSIFKILFMLMQLMVSGRHGPTGLNVQPRAAMARVCARANVIAPPLNMAAWNVRGMGPR